MASPEDAWVEVAYATPERQFLRRLRHRQGMSVLQAIEESGLLQWAPTPPPSIDGVGIFGRKVTLERPLEPGDRVEVYRPLPIDPREARRLRVAQSRTGRGPGRAARS